MKYYTTFGIGFIALLLLAACGCQQQTAEKSEVSAERPVALKDAGTQAQLPSASPGENEAEQTMPKTPPSEVAATATKQPRSQKGKIGPRIAFERTVHDFGEVAPSSTNTCQFEFKNTGDAVLKILKIRSTCGCTVPTLKKKTYGPGESGSITVKYHAGSYAGKFAKSIYVSTNDPNNKRVPLHVKGVIVKKVKAEPARLQLMLKGDNAGIVPITVSSVDGEPFAITSFSATSGAITAEFDKSEKKSKFTLEPQVDLSKLRRATRGTIRIGVNHPQCKMIYVPFTVVPRFETQPRSIIIRDAEPNKPVVRKGVWVLNNYDEQFEVESTSSQKGTIKVLSMEKGEHNNGYKFTLEITPPPRDDDRRRRIFTDVLFVQIKDGPKIRIDCRGLYRVTQ